MVDLLTFGSHDRDTQENKISTAGPPIFYQAGKAVQEAMEAADIFGANGTNPQRSPTYRNADNKAAEAHRSEICQSPTDFEPSPPPYYHPTDASPAYNGESSSSQDASPVSSPITPVTPITPATPASTTTSAPSAAAAAARAALGGSSRVAANAVPNISSQSTPHELSSLTTSTSNEEAGPSRPRRSTLRKISVKRSSGGQMSILEPLRAMTSSWLPKPDIMARVLCNAASHGEDMQIRGLLNQGASINGRNEAGDTALDCAVNAGRISTARLLLAQNANVRHVSKSSGLPPLFRAAVLGDMDMVKLLLGYHADVDQRSLVGHPYFLEICRSAPKETLGCLLHHGADANCTSMKRRTALVQAVRDDDYDLAALLLSFGANARATDITGASLLSVALKKEDDFQLAKLLLDNGASPDSETITRIKVVVDAITTGQLDTARFLLDRHAKGSATTITGLPLLIYVMEEDSIVRHDKIDLVRRLLNNGASPNTKDIKRNRPSLSIALEREQTEIFELLLKNGAKTKYKVNGGESMLSYCVQQKKLAEAQLLLEHGADANMPGKQGRVPLQVAFSTNNIDMVNLLLNYGAILDEDMMAQLEGFDFNALCGEELAELDDTAAELEGRALPSDLNSRLYH